MQPIITTMSFRAAWYFGCPHLAGHTVTLTMEESGYYRVDHATDGTLARVAYPQSVRTPGGVPRAAEARYPHKVPRWARHANMLRPARRPPLAPLPVLSNGDLAGDGIAAVAEHVRAPTSATEGFGGALAIRAMLDPPKELDR